VIAVHGEVYRWRRLVGAVEDDRKSASPDMNVPTPPSRPPAPASTAPLAMIASVVADSCNGATPPASPWSSGTSRISSF